MLLMILYFHFNVCFDINKPVYSICIPSRRGDITVHLIIYCKQGGGGVWGVYIPK